LRGHFERLWPLLEQAVARYGPTHEKEHVWQAIEAGQAQFWPGVNSAMVTEVKVYPTGFREIIGWLAAGGCGQGQRLSSRQSHMPGRVQEALRQAGIPAKDDRSLQGLG